MPFFLFASFQPLFYTTTIFDNFERYNAFLFLLHLVGYLFQSFCVGQKLNALRKPKTNVQILQQSVLLKYKYVILFLKEHGKEAYIDIHAAYIDTMNKSFSGACTSCLWILRLLNIFSVMNSLEKNQCFMTRLQLLRGCLLDFSWSATQFRGARFSGGDVKPGNVIERKDCC